MSAFRHGGLLLPVARMGLAPLAHMPGVLRVPEVVAVGWLAKPAPLTGELAGVTATRLAAVTPVALVTVIEKAQLAATAALTSLRLWAHHAPKAPEPREESKQNRGPEEELRAKKEEELSGEEQEENTQ